MTDIPLQYHGLEIDPGAVLEDTPLQHCMDVRDSASGVAKWGGGTNFTSVRLEQVLGLHSCSKSDLFSMHVGLLHVCHLSPVLFIIFTDRISMRT